MFLEKMPNAATYRRTSCQHCLSQDVNMLTISDLLHCCPKNSDKNLTTQVLTIFLYHNCSSLVGTTQQPCNKSDSPTKLVTSC